MKREIRVEGDKAFVPLTRGYEAIIDAADVPLVASHIWMASVQPHTVYAVRSQKIDGRRMSIRMHRVLLRPSPAMEVDHIDRNGLNNTRANLRLATRAENARNQSIPRHNISGFKGVAWHQRTGMWVATIRVDGRQKHLGSFRRPEDAHAAYCEAAALHYGEFARVA